jgi:hypothetical protein
VLYRRALAVSGLVAATLTACSAAPGPAAAPSTPTATSVAGAPSSSGSAAAPVGGATFTLVATGDVLIHQDLQLTSGARRPDGSYDFVPVMAPVASIIRAADLAICHVETPVAPTGGPYRG